ncbi:alpha/beta hydrolase [Cyclobacterium salsum]|uniref:alpha/beta hydrolase n=1 Tax=Cyclobacterium salsum TaxID=2666329 RepID=UPI001391E681|nr:alpha/beta hydrolase [Cyclobacterium salsum]
MKRTITRIVISILALVVLLVLAFKLSPYPAVWLVRYAFEKEAVRVDAALEKFVPENILAIRDVQFDPTDPNSLLDIYYPKDAMAAKSKLPVIVWTHGGGLVSGNKDHLSNYSKLLASQRFVAISIDYTIAPEAKYPTPIRQLNKALAFISSNADRFAIDSTQFILAGDSGGSMITAATANLISSPSYATITKVNPGVHPDQLKGLLLYCGIYEVDNLNSEGAFASFLNTVTWAYFREKDISNNEYAKTASVLNYLTGSFPPTFISAGNKDPLLAQSKRLAVKLSSLGVQLDTLFFPDNYEPALGHEYQFTFDEDGKRAFERSIQFIDQLLPTKVGTDTPSVVPAF